MWCLAFWALDHRAKVAVHLLCRLRFQLLTGVIWQLQERTGGKTDSGSKKRWRKIRQCVFDSRCLVKNSVPLVLDFDLLRGNAVKFRNGRGVMSSFDYSRVWLCRLLVLILTLCVG